MDVAVARAVSVMVFPTDLAISRHLERKGTSRVGGSPSGHAMEQQHWQP